ncbi:hypothetical protein Tco_0250917 [Tanacetum coccineum]
MHPYHWANIAELSDPEEDPEEDPADGRDDADDESSDDDDDDDVEEDEEDDEEEEHSAPADSFTIPVDDTVPSAEDTRAFETDEPAPTLIPSPPLPLPSPPTTSPTYAEAHLGYRAVEIRLRAASPSTYHPSEIPSPPLLLPSTSHTDDIPEADMPLQKRARFIAPTSGFEVGESLAAAAARQPRLDVATIDSTLGRPMYREVGYEIEDVWDDMVGEMEERAPTTLEDLSQRVTDLSTTLAQDTYEIYVRLEDAQDDRSLQRGRVNMLFRDRRFHRHTTVILDIEARHAREAWSHSMNYSKAVHAELQAYRAQTLEARDPEPQDGPADAGSSC